MYNDSGSTGVEFGQPQANPPQSFTFQNNANDYAASVAETGDICFVNKEKFVEPMLAFAGIGLL